MPEKTVGRILYDPKPKEEAWVPPLSQRPYTHGSGSLPKDKEPEQGDVSRALSNVRV
jgi:hypothetical protein